MELKLQSPKIFVAHTSVDFRKGIDGLSEYVHSSYDCIPTDGIYVFYNKNKDKIKILFWHGNGFVLLQKRLERNKFIMPLLEDKKEIDNKQLSWLIAGLDWEQMNNWNQLTYNDYY